MIDLESDGDLGDDSIFSCGHLAGGNSIPSLLLAEFQSRAQLAQVDCRSVARFESGSIWRRPQPKGQNQTPGGSFSGAESKRLVIAVAEL